MIESITRYVAVGDSFTEGLWDPAPSSDATGPQRGWADRLAESLSAARLSRGLPALEYANHAIRGKLLGHILDEQLPRALDQGPDLVSIIGGGNDVLRPGMDPDALARRLETAVIAARASGARVLMGTGMDPVALPIVRGTREKVATLNSHVWSIANRQGAAVLDLWGLRALQHRDMWSGDRIHLSPEGHHRVAQAALFALGLPPDDPAWRDPLPAVPLGKVERWRETSTWFARDVAPWMTRRLRRRSSGDERTAKLPTPAPFPDS